ncbi:MAG: hypothetical protein ACRCXZ_06245 [Patescibacteria group bacterium]
MINDQMLIDSMEQKLGTKFQVFGSIHSAFYAFHRFLRFFETMKQTSNILDMEFIVDMMNYNYKDFENGLAVEGAFARVKVIEMSDHMFHQFLCVVDNRLIILEQDSTNLDHLSKNNKFMIDNIRSLALESNSEGSIWMVAGFDPNTHQILTTGHSHYASEMIAQAVDVNEAISIVLNPLSVAGQNKVTWSWTNY